MCDVTPSEGPLRVYFFSALDILLPIHQRWDGTTANVETLKTLKPFIRI